MSRNRVRSAVLSMAMIAAVGVTFGVTQTTVSAAQETEITEFHSKNPIAGEDFYVRGTLSSVVEGRPVDLQRLFHDSWKVVDTRATDASGKFEFVTSTTVKRTFRVVAHSQTYEGVAYPILKTASRTITPVTDGVKLSTAQYVVLGDNLNLNVSFAATRVNRPLTVILTHDGTSQVVDQETATGRTMTVTLPSSAESTPTGTYTARVRSEAWHGAPAVTSNKVTFEVVATPPPGSQKTEIAAFDPARPAAGEAFKVKGTIASRLERPVELQRLFHDSWKVVDTVNTDETGRFEFVTRTTVKRTFRVVAHTFKTDAHTYILRKSVARVVTPIEQSIKVSVSPTDITLGPSAQLNLTAAIAPSRVGRPLTVWWTQPDVDEPAVFSSENQNHSTLNVSTPVPADAAKGTYTIWVVADAWNGMTAVKSNTVTFTIK